VRVENSMVLIAAGQGFTLIGRAELSFPDSNPLLAKLNVSFFERKLAALLETKMTLQFIGLPSRTQ
jgi:hypothetical protein